MGAENIRNLLAEARRARARRTSDAARLSLAEQELLQVVDQLIAATEQLLEERDQMGGRLRRTSAFTRPMSEVLAGEAPGEPQEASPAPEADAHSTAVTGESSK